MKKNVETRISPRSRNQVLTGVSHARIPIPISHESVAFLVAELEVIFGKFFFAMIAFLLHADLQSELN